MTRSNSLIFVFLLLATAPVLAQNSTAASIGDKIGLLIAAIIFGVVGAATGWVTGLVLGRSGKGLRGDVPFGIGGTFVAAYVASETGIWTGEVVGGLMAAVIGALGLILIIRLIRRAT